MKLSKNLMKNKKICWWYRKYNWKVSLENPNKDKPDKIKYRFKLDLKIIYKTGDSKWTKSNINLIAGGTASGKTTVADRIANEILKENQ